MHRLAFVVLTGFSCLVAAIAAQAPQAPVRNASAAASATGTATLSGTVVNALTRQPVRRAILTISRSESGVRVAVVSDDHGVFTFRDLPAGQFSVSAAKPGYLAINFGATKPGRAGKPIAIASGEHKSGIAMALTPAGVITGTVRSTTGEPVPNARVVALHYGLGFQTGERTLMQSGPGIGTSTDDRGVYRIHDLAPDDYYLVVSAGESIRSGNELREVSSAEVDWAARQLQGIGAAPAGSPPPPGRAIDYAPVFYPSAFNAASAIPVTLKAGEERGDIDIVLDRVPTSKIVGTIVSPDGPLPANLQVNVIAHDTIPGIPFSGFGSARVDKDGNFSAAGLSPGDYTITVRVPAGRGGAGSQTAGLYGLANVSVNGGDVPVTVTLQMGVTVSGHLTFDATTAKPPADLSRLRVTLNPQRSGGPTLSVPAAPVDANGHFTFVGVTPARYTLFSSVPGWVLKSVTVQGGDALEAPLDVRTDNVEGVEITFTDRHTEIAGTFLAANGQPTTDYYIIAFPVDRSMWPGGTRRIQSLRPQADGHFSIKDLPPGEYYLAAVLDVEPGEWWDPKFLEQLVTASTKVTLREGETLQQSLRIAGG